MAKNMHTPGPWETRRSNDGTGDVGITAPGLPNVLAECFGAMRHRDERALDEAMANARLIAAAPDLLDELRAVVAAIGDWARPTGSNGMIPAGESHPLVVAARAGSAAIAKAEGK